MLDYIIARIAEAKIKEAMERGDFDNLPGKGQPLVLDDLSGIPEEHRVGYILLKNAGFAPEELQVKKDINSLREVVNSCVNQEEKEKLRKELLEKELRYNILMERRRRG